MTETLKSCVKKIEQFDIDKFVKDVRKKQNTEKINNETEINSLIKEIEKHFNMVVQQIDKKYIYPENYTGQENLLILKSTETFIEVRVVGRPAYRVFNEEKFVSLLYKGEKERLISIDSVKKLELVIYYLLYLSYSGQRIDFSCIQEELYKICLLKDNRERDYVNSIIKECFVYYAGTILPEKMPIGWQVGWVQTLEKNNFKVYIIKKGKYNKIQFFSSNLIDLLHYIIKNY